MSKTRQPVRPLSQSATTVAKSAKAERDRKAASKAALKAQNEATFGGPASTQAPKPEPKSDPTPKPDHSADNATALKTQREDWEALGSVGTFEAYLAEQGFAPDGSPAKADKERYAGPMLALVAARASYVKAANGVLCNGDRLALLCGKHSREVTVAALVRALKLPGNPFTHLNPGQQSMNLRNKARHALKNGLLTTGEIEAAYEYCAK